MPKPWLTLVLWLSVAAAASTAQAEEETKKKAKRNPTDRALTFPGSLGLTGMRNMVDSRVPKGTWTARAGVRYDVRARRIKFNGSTPTTRQLERHELSLYGSASLFGLAEVSLRMPYVWESEDNNRKGLSDLSDDNDVGWGNLEGAAKVSFQLGPVVLAPYASGSFPTAEPAVRDLLTIEYGGAATLPFLNGYGGVHLNVAGFYFEEGLHAFRLRVGASFVLLAFRPITLRVYTYLDGIEFEGSADANLSVDFGAQLLLFRFLTVSISANYRIIDANLIQDALEDELRNEGVFDGRFEDEGTFALQLDVGVAF